MAASGIAVEAVLALITKMFERARKDFLPPTHDMRVRARELQRAYEQRFHTVPPDICGEQFVDHYIRAYSAWHVYTGED